MSDPTGRRVALAADSALRDIEGAARALRTIAPRFGRLGQQAVAVVGGSAQGVDQEMVIAVEAADHEVAVALAALAASRSAMQNLRREATLRP